MGFSLINQLLLIILVHEPAEGRDLLCFLRSNGVCALVVLPVIICVIPFADYVADARFLFFAVILRRDMR